MQKIILFTALLFFLPFVSSAETVVEKLYPVDDTLGQLYDVDGFTEWDLARNFLGEIIREPGSSNLEIRNEMTVRSDDGAGRYRIYRVSKTFDLSSVPDDAEIINVTLKLFRSDQNSSDNTNVVVTSHRRADFSIMQKQDWPITNFGEISFSSEKLLIDQYTSFTFNQSGVDYVKSNKDALTIGLLTEEDFEGTEPTNFVVSAGWWASEIPDVTKRPYLEITYEISDDEREGLYTQTVSPYPSEEKTSDWADDYFAANTASNTVSYCGTTIADCGCVITSLVMMARSRGIDEAVDGSDVNPGTFNQWLQSHGGYDAYGNVFWSRAIDFFGRTVDGLIESPFSIDNHRVVSDGDISEAVVDESKHALGFSKQHGHWFLLTDVIAKATTTTYGLLDPFWYNTLTSNDTASATNKTQAYNNTVNRAAVYEYGDAEIGSGIIEATLNSPAELLLIDAAADRTGYVSADEVVEEMSDSGYIQDEFIQNQTTLPVDNPHFTKRILKTNAAGIYELHVIGTGEGEYDLAMSLKITSGEHVLHFFDEPISEGQVDIYIIDMDTGEVRLAEVDRAQFVAATANATASESDEVIAFFDRWANKIFDEIEAGKIMQATQHLDTFETLKRAKGVSGAWLERITDRLRAQLAKDSE